MKRKRKYRIEEFGLGQSKVKGFAVQLKHPMLGWVDIKYFCDFDDHDFAKREAMELLETLEGGKDVKVRLL